MKKNIFLLMLMFVAIAINTLQAQTYNTNNLSPEINVIIENTQKECGLNPTQSAKFKEDYILFLNENSKPNANTNGLFALLGLKFRGYMNNDQFSKITQLVKSGKLNPPANDKADLSNQIYNNSTVSKPAPAPTIAPTPTTSAPLPATISNQSNVSALFVQLESFMKITPDKAAQVIPILKDYDLQLTKIKTENTANPAKIKQLKDALNGQVVPKLKMYMTDQQLGTLVVALGMQESIISGKNISADQKQFLDKIRNQYSLNDAQTMSVILVLVEGKVRGDIIGQVAKVNPQQAGQDFIALMQDLDGKLKTSLDNNQYTKVRSDIEKLLKGQKL